MKSFSKVMNKSSSKHIFFNEDSDQSDESDYHDVIIDEDYNNINKNNANKTKNKEEEEETVIVLDDSDNEENNKSSSDETIIKEKHDEDNNNKIIKNYKKCLMQRKFKNESFGFQVNGKTNQNGSHMISLVHKNSIADIAGLQVNDKIIKVNKIDVAQSTIDQLIKTIEVETNKNPNCLEFTVIPAQKSNNEDSVGRYNLNRKRCNLSNL